MYVVKLSILILLLIVYYGQCREFSDPDLPEVAGFVLEKGKPIQLPKRYEKVQIAGLKGILYSDSLSKLDGVKDLRIKKHGLTAIEKGALCSAPDLKELEVDFYDSTHNLTHLTKEMFASCDGLEKLLLDFPSEESHVVEQLDRDSFRELWQKLLSDEISYEMYRNAYHELLLKFPYKEIPYEIDQNAFEGLTNLKKFLIESYKIKHLKKNFFILPHSLQKIDLRSVEIEEVDSDVFETLKNLEEISVVRNRKWSNLPKNLFKNLPKLKTISLEENGIKGLKWDEFEGLSSIEILNLAYNKITSFDAEKIAKFLPNLKLISLVGNPVPCKQMEAFVEELQEKIGHPIEATYKFDPGFYDPCKYDN